MIHVFLLCGIFELVFAELDTPCTATGSGCYIENPSTDLDTSLLQVGLKLSRQAAVPNQAHADNPSRLELQIGSQEAVSNHGHADKPSSLGLDFSSQGSMWSKGHADKRSSSARPHGAFAELEAAELDAGKFKVAQAQVAQAVPATLTILIFFVLLACAFTVVIESLNHAGNGDRAKSTTTPAAASLLTSGTLQGSVERDEPAPTLQTSASSSESYTCQESSQMPGTPPPPICPALVLRKQEAKFVIDLNALKRPSIPGVIHILGNSGRKLLQAVIAQTPEGGQCLSFSSTGNEDDPRTIVVSPPSLHSQGAFISTPGAAQQELELYGRLDGFYGRIESPPRSTRSIVHFGRAHNPVMHLELESHEDLRITATSPAGNPLASAGKDTPMHNFSGGQQLIPGDTWRLNVKPGADPLLVASCMLALILMKPWSGDPRRL